MESEVDIATQTYLVTPWRKFNIFNRNKTSYTEVLMTFYSFGVTICKNCGTYINYTDDILYYIISSVRY